MAGRDREATRATIFSVAQRMFTERGYAATPLRDIADEAGVDASMIIRYFSSNGHKKRPPSSRSLKKGQWLRPASIR